MNNKQKRMMPKSTVPPNHTIFVQNLPLLLSLNEFKEFFSKFGPLLPSTRIIANRGFGFVDFEKPSSAEAVLSTSDGELKIKNISLKVDRVKPEGTESTIASVSSGFSLYLAGLPRNLREFELKCLCTYPKAIRLVDDNDILNGYVDFETEEDCKSTISNLSQSPMYQNTKMFIEYLNYDRNPQDYKSLDRIDQRQPLSRKSSFSTRPTNSNFIPTTPRHERLIMISSVPLLATIEDLKQVFSVFGKIRVASIKDAKSNIGLKISACLWTVSIQFEHEVSCSNACDELKQEGFSSVKENPTSIKITPLTEPPVLIDILESFSKFGSILAVDVSSSHSIGLVEFENVSSMKECLNTSVFLKGTKLSIGPCNDRDAVMKES